MDVTINDVDAMAWDAFVAQSKNGHFMQTYRWGTMQAQSGWHPHHIQVSDGGAIRATALLLSRRIPGTRRAIFWAPRGPVYDTHDIPAFERLTDALQSYVRSKRGAFLRCDPYETESELFDDNMARNGFEKLPRTWSYWNAPKFVLWLDLAEDEESQYKLVAANRRNEIRAGYRKGVDYSVGTESDLVDFHRLMSKMSAEKGIACHSLEYFQRLMRVMQGSCEIVLVLARLDGEVIACGMSIRCGGKAWLLYAASDSAHFKLRVNRTVQWEMIRWAQRAGCYRYDFRGTATGDPPSPDDPGFGVYEFKKSFGSSFTRMAGYYDLVQSQPMYGIFRYAEDVALPTLYRAKVWIDKFRAGGTARGSAHQD